MSGLLNGGVCWTEGWVELRLFCVELTDLRPEKKSFKKPSVNIVCFTLWQKWFLSKGRKKWVMGAWGLTCEFFYSARTLSPRKFLDLLSILISQQKDESMWRALSVIEKIGQRKFSHLFRASANNTSLAQITYKITALWCENTKERNIFAKFRENFIK